MEFGEPSVPGGIRTPNLLIRSQKLYPVELQAQFFKIPSSKFQIPKPRAWNFGAGIWNLQFAKLGWPTGLEPATTRTTIWGSTIELRPPSWRNKIKIRISFCKQRTRLSSVSPVILAAGGTKISPQLACHGASLSREANGCGFDRTLLFHRGYGHSSGTGRRSKRNFSESLSVCATGRKT